MNCFNLSGHIHLGDSWRGIGVAMRISQNLGEPVGMQYRYGSKSIEHYVRDIPLEMDAPGQVIPVESSPESTYIDVVSRWLIPIPTRITWRGPTASRKKIICCFDGQCNANLKLPPAGAKDEFLRVVERLGCETYSVNGKEPLHDLVERMASSDLFIGVCSGPTQIAYSVGVPVILVKERQPGNLVKIWHGSSPMALVDDLMCAGKMMMTIKFMDSNFGMQHNMDERLAQKQFKK